MKGKLGCFLFRLHGLYSEEERLLKNASQTRVETLGRYSSCGYGRGWSFFEEIISPELPLTHVATAGPSGSCWISGLPIGTEMAPGDLLSLD